MFSENDYLYPHREKVEGQEPYPQRRYISSESFSEKYHISTHLHPMCPFSTPWKHKKTLKFSDIFRG